MCSKYLLARIEENKIIKSTHTANYKQVINFGQDPSGKEDINLYSAETGQSGNLFAGNYFDMNERHLNGTLHTMYTDFQHLYQFMAGKNYALAIHPVTMREELAGRMDL